MVEELPYRIEIDREACMGSGVCTVLAPQTFDIDDESKSIVADPAGNALDRIEAAADGCPTRAVQIVRVAEQVATDDHLDPHGSPD
jgi:ferredoxin